MKYLSNWATIKDLGKYVFKNIRLKFHPYEPNMTFYCQVLYHCVINTHLSISSINIRSSRDVHRDILWFCPQWNSCIGSGFDCCGMGCPDPCSNKSGKGYFNFLGDYRANICNLRSHSICGHNSFLLEQSRYQELCESEGILLRVFRVL